MVSRNGSITKEILGTALPKENIGCFILFYASKNIYSKQKMGFSNMQTYNQPERRLYV
jgi:hypothetical protein